MAFVPCGAAAVCNPVGLPLCVSHWAHSAHWHRAGWMAARPRLLSSCPSQQLPPRCPISSSPAALSFFPVFFLFWFGLFFFPSGTPFVPRPSCRLVHRAGIGLAVRRDSQGSSFLQSPPGNGVPVTLLVPCKVRGLPGAAKGLHPSGMVPWWQLLRGTRAESLQCSC